MPSLSVINQPFGGNPNRLGDHLLELLARTPRFDSSCMAVAYAKASGVTILFNSLQDFVRAGSRLQIAVGIDQAGTSRQALHLLLQAGATVYVFHNPGGETFHPKFYLFQRASSEGVAIVGSNNLTRGGLFENFEFSIRLDHDLGISADAAAFDSFLASFRTITDLSSGMALRLNTRLLARLEAQGYLLDERQTSPRQSTVARAPAGSGNPLFRHVPMPEAPAALAEFRRQRFLSCQVCPLRYLP